MLIGGISILYQRRLLDGSLNVLAGLEVLRHMLPSFAADPRSPSASWIGLMKKRTLWPQLAGFLGICRNTFHRSRPEPHRSRRCEIGGWRCVVAGWTSTNFPMAQKEQKNAAA